MTSVVFLQHGFAISKQKDRQLDQQFMALDFQEWSRLSVLAREKISPFLEDDYTGADGVDESHVLSTVGTARNGEYEVKLCKKLVLGRYLGGKTVSIRLFHGLNPCKTGVTLNRGEYECIRSCLFESEEASATADIYKALCTDAINDAKMKVCDGCRDSLPSQLDHVCLDRGDGDFLCKVKRSGVEVSFADFTERLVERMRAEGFECKEAYKWFTHHRQHIKPTLLAELVGSGTEAQGQRKRKHAEVDN